MAINYDKLASDLFLGRTSTINKLEKRKNDVDRYLYITSVFAQNEPISDNEEFKAAYKSCYVMRTAGLSQQHFEKYFELLDRRVNNLETILNELYVRDQDLKTTKQPAIQFLQLSYSIPSTIIFQSMTIK